MCIVFVPLLEVLFGNVNLATSLNDLPKEFDLDCKPYKGIENKTWLSDMQYPLV